MGTIVLAIIGGLAYFPVEYTFGNIEKHGEDIQDLKILIGALPSIQQSIDGGFSSTNERIDKTNEEITKLRLLICQDSKGIICN